MSDSLPNPEVSEKLIPGIADLLDEASESQTQPPLVEPIDTSHAPPEAMVSFGHVSIWLGDRRILEDISFTVHRGETLCILGRSGVGKSVALRILMGFLKPQVGSIKVAGEEINEFSEEDMRAVRKKVTMVFQNGALFDSLSVRENVAFPLRELGGLAEDQIQEIVERLIAMVGAEDVADAFPASLSTGRKRAVSIARALAAQPDVVLYDEPTTMVDPIIARRLGDLYQHCGHARYALCRKAG
jgi:phospholipid/cholesterol/gamma-HCH transport system ATP-binding protein